MQKTLISSAAIVALMSGAAVAQDAYEITGEDVLEQAEEANTGFSAEFSIEVENDYIFDSDDKAAELNDTFPTIEAALSYGFTPNVSLNTSLVLEPVEDAVNDRFFEDLGLYAEEVYLYTNLGPVAAVLGKFNPSFGMAWDAAPGIYGVDFAEDYEITEKLGGTLIVPFTAAGGEHEFAVSLFTADRTFLSDSLGEERGKLRRRDGGVSNTNSPESINVALTGEISGTNYNLGVQSQQAGRGDAKDQVGGVFGLTRDFGGFELLGEVAYFDHFDGTRNSATYATLGGSVPITDRLSLSGVYSHRDIEGGTADHLATATAEFQLSEGLTLAAAYRYGDEGGDKSHTFGTLVAYEF